MEKEKGMMVRFSKYNIAGLILSFVITGSLVGVTISRGGFNLGVDFRSGQSIEVFVPEADDTAHIREMFIEHFPQIVVTRSGRGEDKTFTVKIASTEEEQNEKLVTFEKQLGEAFENAQILETSFIGGTLSRQLLRSALMLTSIALLLILCYIGIRFRFRFAFAAIVALVHDAFFVLGVIGAFHIEVTISTVAAVLTIVGYSLNDTIVIFDRIRENMRLMKGLPLPHITDSAISKTLSRTIITTLTTVLAVIAIYVFASGDVQNFAKTLLIGLVEGVWSSVFIATPMLYLLGLGKKSAPTAKIQSVVDAQEKGEQSSLRESDTALRDAANDDIASRAAKIREEIKARKRKQKGRNK